MSFGEALRVYLGADADPLVKEFNKAAREVKKFGSEVQESLEKAREAAATIFGIGITAGATEYVKSTIETVGALKDQADQIGLNVEKFQELRFAARQAGVDQETFAGALNKLSRLLGEAYDKGSESAKTFQKWGITVRDAHGNLLPLETVLNKVADLMANIKDPALRSAAAVDLLSKSGPSLINFLADGSKGLAEMSKQAREMGAVIDEKTVTAAKELGDKLAALGDVITANLAKAILGLIDVWDKLGKRFEEWDQDILTQHIADMAEEAKTLRERLASLEQFPSSADSASDVRRIKIRLKEIHDEAVALQPELQKLKIGAGGEQKTEGDKAATTAGIGKGPVNVQALEAYKNYLIQLQQEHELLQLTGAAREKLRAQFDIENRLRQMNVALTTAQKDEVLKLAEANLQAASKAQYQEEVTSLREQIELLKHTGVEKEKLQKYYETEDKMRRAGIVLSSDEKKNIMTLSETYAKLSEEQKKHAEYLQQIKQFGSQLASDMASAFEDAVVAGKDLRSVMSGLLQDIEKMLIRMAIIKPLTDGIGDLVGGALGGGGFLANLFGGFRAGGGGVQRGRAYMVGERGPELFMPGISGNIIPSGGFGGGSTALNASFAINVQVEGGQNAGSDPQSAMQAGAAIARAAQSQLMMMLQEQKRPGGILFQGR